MNAFLSKNRKTTVYSLLVLALSVTPIVTQAKDYKVEVLVFKNLIPSRATESHNYQEPRQMTSGSDVWAIEPTMLMSQAETLNKSSDYELMHHFSWGQEALRYAASATYTVAEPNFRGAIKVYADSLLFVNLDLDYDGYRMNEKRRLKLNERHFFDHPKFGILLQVSRLEKPVEPELESENSQKEPPLVLEQSR